MTYSAMLKISPEELLIATDRASTSSNRIYTNVNKIADKGRYAVVNAGSGERAKEITKRWEAIPPKESFKEELSQFKSLYQAVYDENFKDYVPRKFGVTYDDYIRGNISKDLMQTIASDAKTFATPSTSEESFNTYFLFGGEDDHDMEIYFVGSPGIARIVPNRFEIIGAGGDLGEDPLYSFTHRFLPEEPIPKSLVLHETFSSLVHSYRNVVVGGIPEIAFADKTHVERLDDRVSAVAFNTFVKELDGKISSEEANQLFEKLLDKDLNLEALAEKVGVPTDYILMR